MDEPRDKFEEESALLNADPEEVKRGFRRLVAAYLSTKNPTLRKKRLAEEFKKMDEEKRKKLH